tara:strand:+ start:48 stop:494 length:447 start_codon:yes stop_codon:yes gene_type:complete
MFKKKQIEFTNNFDFNTICDILDLNDFENFPVGRWFERYILDAVFKIKQVHRSKILFTLFKSLNEKYNLKKDTSDLDIFYCMTSGGKSPPHLDEYDIYIIGVQGKTLYKLNNKEFLLEKGDVLYIPKHTIHSAIGLSPRIILSFAIRN